MAGARGREQLRDSARRRVASPISDDRDLAQRQRRVERLQERARRLRVLDDEVARGARAIAIVRAGSTCSGGTTPSRLGTRIEPARHRSRVASAAARARRRPASRSMRRERGSAAGRSAPSDRRFRCARTARCRAPSDFTAARAVVGPLAIEVRVDLGRRQARETCCARRPARVSQRPRRGVEQREPGVEDDRPARQRASAARRALSRSPGLPIGCAVAVGDLVGADDERVADAAPRRCAPWPRRGGARSAPAPRRRAASRRRPARRRRTASRGVRAARAGSGDVDASTSGRWPAGWRLTVVFAGIFDTCARIALLSNVFARPAQHGARRGRAGGRRQRHGGGHDRAAATTARSGAARGTFDAFDLAARQRELAGTVDAVDAARVRTSSRSRLARIRTKAASSPGGSPARRTRWAGPALDGRASTARCRSSASAACGPFSWPVAQRTLLLLARDERELARARRGRRRTRSSSPRRRSIRWRWSRTNCC